VAWALDILVQDGSEEALPVIWGLLRACPESVMHENQYGWLAFHSLCRYNGGPKASKIAEWLINLYPHGARTPTPMGAAATVGIRGTTAGNAAGRGASGRGVRGPFGYYPLHLLARYNSGPCVDDIARQILEEYPDSARNATPDGSLPLHLLCRNSRPDKGLNTRLLRAYPHGALVESEGGELPLKLLARYNTGTANQMGLSGYELWCEEASSDPVYREMHPQVRRRLLEKRWEAMGAERREKYIAGPGSHEIAQQLINRMQDQPYAGEDGMTADQMERGVGESFIEWIKRNKAAGTPFAYPIKGQWTPTPPGRSSLARGDAGDGNRCAKPPPSELLSYYQGLPGSRTWVEDASGYPSVEHVPWK